MVEIKNYVGIDFGTTNSASTVITSTEFGTNVPQKITDYDGGPIPSLIVIDKITGQKYFGREAWQRRRELSENCEVITSLKSYLGTKKEWDILGEKWDIIKLTSEVLKNIALKTKEKHHCTMEEVVFAVPAGFSSEKRIDLKKAAINAGITIKTFISEPTAAYFKNYSKLKYYSKVAIFDWGGGTLDVSVISIENSEISELAIKSLRLGGDDIDLKIAKWVHSQIIKESGLKKRFEEMPNLAQDALITKSEMAKRTFGENDIAKISINDYGGFQVNINFNIETFSKLIEPDITETIRTLEEAVSEANLSMQEIECILMVGGSSNLAPLLNKVGTIWENIEFSEEAEWCVAEGAALLNSKPGQFYINQDIGLLLSDDSFFPLIEKNEIVPTYLQEKEFGIIEENDLANFIFTDGNKIIGIQPVPVYGFSNENIKIDYCIDENFIFKAVIKSDHRPLEFSKTYEFSNIKLNYKLPNE